jgi:hypothetical protein
MVDHRRFLRARVSWRMLHVAWHSSGALYVVIIATWGMSEVRDVTAVRVIAVKHQGILCVHCLW